MKRYLCHTLLWLRATEITLCEAETSPLTLSKGVFALGGQKRTDVGRWARRYSSRVHVIYLFDTLYT